MSNTRHTIMIGFYLNMKFKVIDKNVDLQKTERNFKMKKISIIMIIVVLSVFTSASVVLAKRWNRLHGIYEMSATGSCLHSSNGFDEENAPPYIPNENSIVWGATTMAYGTWYFYSNGTGHASGMNYPMDFPPNGALGKPAAREKKFGYNIKHQLEGNEVIIDLYLPDPDKPYATYLGELIGTVSKGKRAIIIQTANQLFKFGPPLYHAVCNTARLLILLK